MKTLILTFVLVITSCTVRKEGGGKLLELSKVKRMYTNVVQLENQSRVDNLPRLVSTMTDLWKGKDVEGQEPFWIIPQMDLLQALDSLRLSPEEHQDLRFELIREFGLIGPLVRMEKSIVVQTYICRTDKYAIEESELLKRGLSVEKNGTILLKALNRYIQSTNVRANQ